MNNINPEQYYLDSAGKERLQKDLNTSDNPLELIQNLQTNEFFDTSQYSPLYYLTQDLNISANDCLNLYFQQQLSTIKEQINFFNTQQLQQLLSALKPYSLIPGFKEIIQQIIEKLPTIPTWFPLPRDFQNDLSSDERAHHFLHNEYSHQQWLEETFEKSKLDFRDSDDFSYNVLFDKIVQFTYKYPTLYRRTIDYCEKQFCATYHPVFSVIRTKLCLYNSTLADSDPGKPFASSILNAVNQTSKVDFHQIYKRSKCCSSETIFTIISLPQFILKFKSNNYFQCLAEPTVVKQWEKILKNPTEDVIPILQKNYLMTRFLTLAAIHNLPLEPVFYEYIGKTIPQCDIAYILCRNYDPKFEPLLKGWAIQSGTVFLDYATLKKLRREEITIQSPTLSENQQTIFNAIQGIQFDS